MVIIHSSLMLVAPNFFQANIDDPLVSEDAGDVCLGDRNGLCRDDCARYASLSEAAKSRTTSGARNNSSTCIA